MKRLLALALLLLLGCAEPLQQGGVIVLPGATERLILAMRLGYAGMGDVKPPAAVRSVATADDLILGPAAVGKIGDIRLENQTIAAIVSKIGGPHGGNLVDLARKSGGHLDELGDVETIVWGEVVHYDTLKTGTDDATNAAFVQVTGHIAGHPDVVIATRYDVAPELDTVLIHTSLVVSAPLAGPIAIGDVVTIPGNPTWPEASGFVAALGKTSGYAVKPLVDAELTPPSMLHAEGAGTNGSIGLDPSAVASGTFVYSRMIAPLDRPDTLALASALAAGDGQELSEVELSFTPQSFGLDHAIALGKFVFSRPDNPAKLELVTDRTIRLGDTVSAKLPAGSYVVTFETGGSRSRGATFRAHQKQLASVTLDAAPDKPSPKAAHPPNE